MTFILDKNGQPMDHYELLMRRVSFWNGITVGALVTGIPLLILFVMATTFMVTR